MAGYYSLPSLRNRQISDSLGGRQIGADLAIGLCGKPMCPCVAGQVVSEARASLVSQIARTPAPKRGNAFIVSGKQIAAVGTARGCTDIARIGKLRQASAGDGIPDREMSVSGSSKGGERGIGND